MTLAGTMQEIADALQPVQDEIPDLQVYAFWNDDPSPPCVDVYPGSPFQDGAGFRPGDNRIYWTVRARVAMADVYSAQSLLLRMLDGEDDASVEVALAAIEMAVVPDGVTGFTQYADDTSAVERMLGCEWRVSRFL